MASLDAKPNHFTEMLSIDDFN